MKETGSDKESKRSVHAAKMEAIQASVNATETARRIYAGGCGREKLSDVFGGECEG